MWPRRAAWFTAVAALSLAERGRVAPCDAGALQQFFGFESTATV